MSDMTTIPEWTARLHHYEISTRCAISEIEDLDVKLDYEDEEMELLEDALTQLRQICRRFKRLERRIQTKEKEQ